MTDAGIPPPDGGGQPLQILASRFTLDESYQGAAPRGAQGLRDWWWSGTRGQRWTAALGVPLSLVLIGGTVTALADDKPEQQAAATSTTTERSTAEVTRATPTPTFASAEIGTVTTIMTGDTVVVQREDGPETVRLIGIDAPEMDAGAAGQQCWATESRRFASDMLLQKQVHLIADPTQGAVDAAGATLAYLLLPDTSDFSVVSARAGHARSYTAGPPAAKSAEIAAAEQVARTGRLGLWGEPCDGGLTLPTRSVTPTPTTTTPPAPPPPPPPPPPNDPRFNNCFQAKNAGYGPYVMGVDPEYYWYPDKDQDGVVCERIGD